MKPRDWRRTVPLLGMTALVAAGCGDAEAPASRRRPNLLDAAGEGASMVAREWWVQFTLGGLIFLGVVALVVVIAFRAGRRPGGLDADMGEPPRTAYWWIIGGGVALPLFVLTWSLVFSMNNLIALSASPDEEAMVIEVTGHRWWWEVDYPGQGITTANEVRVPVGEPVRVVLRSEDVIHSFWVPEVHGKMDLIPGRENSMWLEANQAGVFRGLCAEFCGLQHARMHFMLVAMPQEQFDAWVQEQQRPASSEPLGEAERAGQQVFMDRGCASCHTIRGTTATGWVGPDLTHLASRFTIVAGTLDNNAGNLGGWIADPQRIKPGALMPATELSGEELTALIEYLRSLE